MYCIAVLSLFTYEVFTNPFVVSSLFKIDKVLILYEVVFLVK